VNAITLVVQWQTGNAIGGYKALALLGCGIMRKSKEAGAE